MVFQIYSWFYKSTHGFELDMAFPNLPMVLNFPFIPRIAWGTYFYFGNHVYMCKLLLHGEIIFTWGNYFFH